MSSRVIHFEIPASDPNAVVKFFQDTFGWKIERYSDQPYWLCTTGKGDEAGIDGAIMQKESGAHHVQNTIGVDNIEESRKTIVANGGTLTSEVMDIPNIGKFCYFKDPDGNVHGIIQPVEMPK
ncbi:MAG TPA: VOC family protein [Chitinophagaceae bacterium]|nr:VOC family protein [Chitinophagaceae bacterium]